ncbi:MAG TPA: nucleotide exchange factor GrpE [Actinomycetota bacterium]|nr:nucleotide exchange factor GrpE [Actinomycetota bacterium]
MTDRRRLDGEDREAPEEERPRIRVTDKRRVRDGEPSIEHREADASQNPGAGAASPQPGDELAEARRQAAEYLEHLQRLKAEFDNYRKRVLKEQTRSVELATEPVMAKLLEVLDEFELALMAAEAKPDFDKFLRGVELVYAKLTDILRSEGLERIDAEGKPFDPERHEALLQGEGEGEPYVADVLRPGYTLRGRVIRPAGVKVSRRNEGSP